MKTGLTSSSFFGKYVPNERMTQLASDRVTAINLKQNYTHERPFVSCKFDIPGSRLYLLDTKGILINLNLNDNSFSTLKSEKIQNFTIDGNNSLNILYVTQKSELFQVSFDTKKPTKITNLNLNKIRAFERNYLRDMLLALDYKVLFLCDVTKSGQLKIKSLKANHNEVFTNACFASNNRFIILAVKNVQIRIIEIMDLKSLHEIKLPFVVNQLKIQVSYDSKKIAIYGDCNIVFFINVLEGPTYSYELIEIPFLKAVAQLRYTCQNDIVFLGSDQILYAVSSGQPDKAIPIFNQQFQIRTMNFDISLDCTKIALVSNRTVMQLKFPKGLRHQLQERSSFKQMEYRKNGFQGYRRQGDGAIVEDSKEQLEDQEDGKIQYEDEDGSEEEEKDERPEINVDGLKHEGRLPSYKQQCGQLHSQVAQLKSTPLQTKTKLNQILTNLLSTHPNLQKHRIQPIIKSLLKLTQEYDLEPEQCYRVMDFVIDAVKRQGEKMRHYGLILCPEIVAVVERKLGRNWGEFCEERILGLYGGYFRGGEWKEAVNWLLSPGVNEKIENLSIFLICILEDLSQKISTFNPQDYTLLLDTQQIELTFAQIYNRVVKIYLDDRYKNLFLKRKIVEMVHEKEIRERDQIITAGLSKVSDARLEELILRQDQIKRALSDLKRSRNKK